MISNGNIAILAESKKPVKTGKTIRKVNPKVTKEVVVVVEENLVDESQKNEIKEDDSKKKIRSSPRNQSNTDSLEESTVNKPANAVKRRPKKINDCIAKLQEKLGLPFFGTTNTTDSTLDESKTTNDVLDIDATTTPKTSTETAPVKEVVNPSENNEKLIKTPKRKSLTRKIVKTESMPSLSKKIETTIEKITTIKPIQIQTVHPTIQQSTPQFPQKPIAHVEAIRPKHITNTNLPPRRPSILLPTLVPPPPPPPIILPSTVTLNNAPCLQDDTPLDLSRKPPIENGALDLSKPSRVKSSDSNTLTIADILQNKIALDSQNKRRKNKKEIVSVPPIPKPAPPLPIVNELKNKLPNVSITSKCVLNIPQTPTFEKGLETVKKPIKENTQLVIPNFKGCVDIIKIPAPKPPVIHAEKPSVTIKAIPPPSPVVEKLQEKGFISAFESFIEKKAAADNTVTQPLPVVIKDVDLMPVKEKKTKAKRTPKKAKGKFFFVF